MTKYEDQAIYINLNRWQIWVYTKQRREQSYWKCKKIIHPLLFYFMANETEYLHYLIYQFLVKRSTRVLSDPWPKFSSSWFAKSVRQTHFVSCQLLIDRLCFYLYCDKMSMYMLHHPAIRTLMWCGSVDFNHHWMQFDCDLSTVKAVQHLHRSSFLLFGNITVKKLVIHLYSKELNKFVLETRSTQSVEWVPMYLHVRIS